jgi:hypothetical protein
MNELKGYEKEEDLDECHKRLIRRKEITYFRVLWSPGTYGAPIEPYFWLQLLNMSQQPG